MSTVNSEVRRRDGLASLAEDWFRTVMLDLAEEIYLSLRGTRHNNLATYNLLDIYQQEKEWLKAVDVARSLSGHEGVRWRKEIANFYCELADNALASSNPDQARGYIDEALQMNRGCVRASILLGDLLLAEARVEDAIEAWKRVENQDPVYLSLVAERVMDAHVRLDRAEQGQTLLRAWLEREPTLDLMDQVFRWEIERHGPRAAYELVRRELRRNPTVLGLEKLLEAASQQANPEQRDDIELVKQLIHGHTRRVARYRCAACGFKAREFQWRCPACGGWETYPPLRTEEFDLAP